MAQREGSPDADDPGGATADADPSTDPRADYDYQGGEEHRPDLVAALRDRVDGEVRFDEYSRQLYATDASAYEVTPVGVVFPTSTDDVAAVMAYCADQGIPVLPRGGGTSLAGQTVNEAVVLDFTKHMDRVLSVDPDPDAADRSADEALPGTATAQPGVTLAELNAACDPHGLKFAPDPAWGDKSALGGAIGNNSTGAHSLQYGKTDAYVESCEVVLADGTVTEFGEVDLETIRAEGDPDPEDGDRLPQIYEAVRRVVDENGDEIEAAYPDLKRNVSGYNLDRLVAEARGGIDDAGADLDPEADELDPDVTELDRVEEGVDESTGRDVGDGGTINLARLLAGSEGTLGIVTEATVALEPIPATKAVALLAYDDLLTAMEDVAPILEHDPAAVEVLDDVLLDLARDTEEFGALVETVVPEGTGALLLVEFYAEDDAHGREQVADLLADRVPPDVRTTDLPPPGDVETDADHRAFAGLEAHHPGERERFWKLRKSGLPILLSRTTDEKHISFIEDCAVPPEHLPEYVERFQAILDDHDTFASFYAHAGPGVLHVRPLVDTKSLDGVEGMLGIADAVTDLVVELGGSVSGEHGDGRARSQWNRKLYGDDLWNLSRDLKTAFDPDWLLNPGQVCGDESGAIDMAENLRFDPEYEFDAGFDPELAWENPNGMQGMVELCHGCGGCRGDQEHTGGTMCPTFRAAEEESLSTRGRANALRQAMSGDLPDDPVDEEFVDEILDLCIGCKGCARDCPSEVDMATLKAELTHQYHEEHGTSLRDRLFGDVRRWAMLGSATAPISNWLASLPGSGWIAERTLGLASERDLPTFERTTFTDWMAERDPAIAADEADHRVLCFPDTYTEFIEPEIGRAAVSVLEAAGVHVKVPDGVTDSGRPAYSKGLLDRARDRAERNVAALEPAIEDGWDVVAVEPSEAAMFQADYANLLGADAAETVAENTYGVLEYLDKFDLPVPSVDGDADPDGIVYHGHCHQTAVGREHHTPTVLERAGYDVHALDSGCCGMAGSFGYEAEHFSMSEAIGAILFEQVEDVEAGVDEQYEVVAPGTSCRSQFWDLRERDVSHPIEVLAAGIDG